MSGRQPLLGVLSHLQWGTAAFSGTVTDSPRKPGKGAADHQVWGPWNNESAGGALVTSHGPLAKRDAALGACLCGRDGAC